jgi:branched-chain amino acid aminotransferase
MEPIALFNGEILPQSQATLALNDAGFVFGATVTDLCRTFRRVLYRWPEHLARFHLSSDAAFINVPFSDEQITAWATELIARNAEGKEQILVLFATPGPIGYYLGQPGGAGDGPPTFGMHTFPLPFERYRGLIERGAILAMQNDPRQIDPLCIDPRIKHRSRLLWWLADRQVQKSQPGAQALLLLHAGSGHVTETATANFLIVKRGKVISPLRQDILNGVSLGVVEELCARLGIAMTFRFITPEDAMTADEAMLSSTPYCLAPVCKINGKMLPRRRPVMQQLIDAWSAEVGVDIHGQFTAV